MTTQSSWSKTVTKVIVADDHAIVREGLRQILSETDDIIVVDEAKNGKELLDKVKKNKCDMVLLDISMPGPSGLEVLKELKKEMPKLPVLVLTMHPEEQYAVRVLKMGASGYLTKESAPDELIGALRRVRDGRKYISHTLAEKLAVDLEAGIERPLKDMLSDREFEVMCMIASGKKIKEIANELSLSTKTISTYRARILEKMNMKSNAEIISYAIRNNLPCKFCE